MRAGGWAAALRPPPQVSICEAEKRRRKCNIHSPPPPPPEDLGAGFATRPAAAAAAAENNPLASLIARSASQPPASQPAQCSVMHRGVPSAHQRHDSGGGNGGGRGGRGRRQRRWNREKCGQNVFGELFLTHLFPLTRHSAVLALDSSIRRGSVNLIGKIWNTFACSAADPTALPKRKQPATRLILATRIGACICPCSQFRWWPLGSMSSHQKSTEISQLIKSN